MKNVKYLNEVRQDMVYIQKTYNVDYYLIYLGYDSSEHAICFYRIPKTEDIEYKLQEVLNSMLESYLFRRIYLNKENRLFLDKSIFKTNIHVKEDEIQNWYIKNKLINQSLPTLTLLN